MTKAQLTCASGLGLLVAFVGAFQATTLGQRILGAIGGAAALGALSRLAYLWKRERGPAGSRVAGVRLEGVQAPVRYPFFGSLFDKTFHPDPEVRLAAVFELHGVDPGGEERLLAVCSRECHGTVLRAAIGELLDTAPDVPELRARVDKIMSSSPAARESCRQMLRELELRGVTRMTDAAELTASELLTIALLDGASSRLRGVILRRLFGEGRMDECVHLLENAPELAREHLDCVVALVAGTHLAAGAVDDACLEALMARDLDQACQMSEEMRCRALDKVRQGWRAPAS